MNPVNGNQQPDITWFLNDVELDQNDPRFTYTVNGCQRKIRINHPKHEESGIIKAYNPGKNPLIYLGIQFLSSKIKVVIALLVLKSKKLQKIQKFQQ